MSNVISVRVDENLAFLVEAPSNDEALPALALGSVEGLPPGAIPTGRFTDAMSGMSTTVRAVVKFIRDGFVHANHPDELSVEFSVALKGEMGVPVVTSGSAEGTFKISAKWTTRPTTPS